MLNISHQQLSDFLLSIKDFKSVSTPAKGWVRAIRDGLGMSRRQLAARLGLSISRIQRLEQDEVTGAVTLKTMRRTAEAMDCVFVYALIPQISLEATLKDQALKKAQQSLQEVSHSMSLESQALNKSANKEMLDKLAQQYIDQSKRVLWD